jgi:hypothetical protein
MLLTSLATPVLAQDSTRAVPLAEATLKGDEVISTNVGEITLVGTYLTDESIKRLADVQDYQRATEVYQWAFPFVEFNQWKEQATQVYGAGDFDFVVYKSFNEKLGIVTANATTPYIIGFLDLSKTGPVVLDYPVGKTAGGIMDFWQRSIADVGLEGPDKGKGGTYLILPPGADPAKFDSKKYFLVQMTTSKAMIGLRLLSPDPKAGQSFMDSLKFYPFGKAPKAARFIKNTNKAFDGTAPSGLAYFESLHRAIQDEPVAAPDKAFHSFMRYLGIEDGKAFKPDARMKRILTEGANMGELMARANQIQPRHDKPWYPGTNWYRLLGNFPIAQDDAKYLYIDERNQYFFEAVAATKGMMSDKPGPGVTSYLEVKKDKDGKALLGQNTYKLHVPANVPAGNFWALTLYSEQTRRLIDNKKAADKALAANLDSRRPGLVKNSDGTVDLYIGPKAPAGKASNWVQTIPGEGWFPLFRFYATKQAFFDKSWSLDDIEKIAP